MACPAFTTPSQEWQPGQEQQWHQPRLDRQQRDDDPADRGDRADGADQPVDHLDRPVLTRGGPYEAVVKGRRLVRGQLYPFRATSMMACLACRAVVSDSISRTSRPAAVTRPSTATMPTTAAELRGDRADAREQSRRRLSAASTDRSGIREDEGDRQAGTVDQFQDDAGDQHPRGGRPHQPHRVSGDARQQPQRLGPFLASRLRSSHDGGERAVSSSAGGSSSVTVRSSRLTEVMKVNRAGDGRRCRRPAAAPAIG